MRNVEFFNKPQIKNQTNLNILKIRSHALRFAKFLGGYSFNYTGIMI